MKFWNYNGCGDKVLIVIKITRGNSVNFCAEFNGNVDLTDDMQ
ncbi:hypothetical protein [Bacillus sp. FJAT-49711]|nr:hypothetical protein [Bacillus sp. FJAT-49711]